MPDASGLSDTYIWTVVAFGGVLTLFNRLAGHYILARFEPIHPRLEAALEAVPIAVITSLVVPAVINGGPAEWACLALAMVLSLRFEFLISAFVPLTLLVLARHFAGM